MGDLLLHRVLRRQLQAPEVLGFPCLLHRVKLRFVLFLDDSLFRLRVLPSRFVRLALRAYRFGVRLGCANLPLPGVALVPFGRPFPAGRDHGIDSIRSCCPGCSFCSTFSCCVCWSCGWRGRGGSSFSFICPWCWFRFPACRRCGRRCGRCAAIFICSWSCRICTRLSTTVCGIRLRSVTFICVSFVRRRSNSACLLCFLFQTFRRCGGLLGVRSRGNAHVGVDPFRRRPERGPAYRYHLLHVARDPARPTYLPVWRHVHLVEEVRVNRHRSRKRQAVLHGLVV
mmetsp:Transcript_4706/g.11548  ORF Transcript_4706/g.11548 Transcript_4706/m.11548 type:complete len:284 (+) Transcript_4706:1000-1851(+)